MKTNKKARQLAITTLGIILLILLVLLLAGAFPTGGYGIGYYGHSGLIVVLIVVCILAFSGRI